MTKLHVQSQCSIWSFEELPLEEPRHKLTTKVNVYKAAVLSSLLYGCETWTLYKKHVLQLEAFYMRCLRRICNIRWQDRVPDTTVLEMCGATSIQSRWAGHIVRMNHSCIPKVLFYGQLKGCSRRVGRPRLRYKSTLKGNLIKCGMSPNTWEADARNRSSWRSRCGAATKQYEKNRIATPKQKPVARKT